MIKQLFCTAVLLAGSSLATLAAPLLSVTPSVNNVLTGNSFTLNINIASVVDLYGWQLDIDFGPVGLLTGNSISEGSFLGLGTSWTPGTINNGTATIIASANSLSGLTGVSGSGVLAQISFTAASVGTAIISISNIQLLDSNLDSIFPDPPVSATVNITSGIPEPATFVMLGMGLAFMAVRRRA